MAKRDDSTLCQEDAVYIRREAKRLLQESDALGVFPTPIDAILDGAKVVVTSEDVLSQSFLNRLRKGAGNALKRALSKVLGVLDTVARIIYVDRGVAVVQQTFLKLHETAHAWLPEQSQAYRLVEDSSKELSSQVSELFDRQANAFASEVLFQLDSFTEEAAGYEFGVKVPIELSKKYGASLYSSIRRYVSHSPHERAVFVLNKPKYQQGAGRVCTLRRFVASEGFKKRFRELKLADVFSENDPIGRSIPRVGNKMSRPRTLVLKDANGKRHDCVAEGFTQTHQVFILVCPVAALTRAYLITA